MKRLASLVWLSLCLTLNGCIGLGQDDPGVLPPTLEGNFHLPGMVDSVNLSMEPSGSFQWGIDGCDFRGGDLGRWERNTGNSVALLPPIGRTTFTWTSGVTFAAEVDRVVITSTSGGLRAVSTSRTEFDQSWDGGGICPDCSGPLGPAGQEPCEDPYLGGI